MIYSDSKNSVNYIDVSDFHYGKNGQQFPVISLFSGAGGLDIGLEQAGFHTAICIENDADCRATLKYNRPEWKVFEDGLTVEKGKIAKRNPGDIREIEVAEVLQICNLKKGQAALVVGGAPCQPFSNIGKRQGKEDKKNGDLFLEFVRFVKEAEPKAFIFENVVGITQRKHSEVIQYMLDKFSGLGYGLAHTILNAADYGVPQKRERFFLIGIKGVKSPAFPLPTHYRSEKSWNAFIHHLTPTPLNRPQQWFTVKQAFKRIPKSVEKRKDFVAMNVSDIIKERMKLIKQGENFKVLPLDMRPDCWKNGKHQGQDTFGRIVEDLPSVTIRTAAYNPTKGMYIHPVENRGLNSIEMATLQSFPLEWNFKCVAREKVTLVSCGKQIGNAVPPLLAQAIGAAIKKQILTMPVKSGQKRPLLAATS